MGEGFGLQTRPADLPVATHMACRNTTFLAARPDLPQRSASSVHSDDALLVDAARAKVASIWLPEERLDYFSRFARWILSAFFMTPSRDSVPMIVWYSSAAVSASS